MSANMQEEEWGTDSGVGVITQRLTEEKQQKELRTTEPFLLLKAVYSRLAPPLACHSLHRVHNDRDERRAYYPTTVLTAMGTM